MFIHSVLFSDSECVLPKLPQPIRHWPLFAAGAACTDEDKLSPLHTDHTQPHRGRCVQPFMQMCKILHVHVHVILAHIRVHTHAHTHIIIRTHIHVHMHTRSYVPSLPPVTRHQVPIGQMGNYQEHLKHINPLRELDSGSVRTQLFGNPFKLERVSDIKVHSGACCRVHVNLTVCACMKHIYVFEAYLHV